MHDILGHNYEIESHNKIKGQNNDIRSHNYEIKSQNWPKIMRFTNRDKKSKQQKVEIMG